MPFIPVQDLSDPRLTPYINMRDAELAQRADPLDPRAHAGLFIAEGELVVRRLIASRFRTHSVLTTPTRLDPMRNALDHLPPATPVLVAPQPVLDSIIGFNMHRGVLAVGYRDQPLFIADILSRCAPVLVLEDLVNHDNLGGIFRNAAALGGRDIGVILSPRCADPLYRKSLRVSMGTILSVPFTRAGAWPQALRDFTAAGFETWALSPSGATTLRTACEESTPSRTRRIVLVLGTEGPGLSESAAAACTRLVQIPMRRAHPAVDSLNVAMAAGIALHALGEAGLIES